MLYSSLLFNIFYRHTHTYNYLGTVINKVFTFNEHKKQVTRRCKKLIYILLKSAKINWSLDHKALRKITMEQFLPLLSHGALI